MTSSTVTYKSRYPTFWAHLFKSHEWYVWYPAEKRFGEFTATVLEPRGDILVMKRRKSIFLFLFWQAEILWKARHRSDFKTKLHDTFFGTRVL